MKKFKPTKWKDHKFSQDELKAQALWRHANKTYCELTEILCTSPESHDREYLHTRLDMIINSIERTREAARAIFPEVSDSFAVATMKL